MGMEIGFFMGMGGNGNGNGFMGMGGNRNRNSPSRTPLLATRKLIQTLLSHSVCPSICPSVCLSATAWVTRMYAALRVASHVDYRLVCPFCCSGIVTVKIIPSDLQIEHPFSMASFNDIWIFGCTNKLPEQSTRDTCSRYSLIFENTSIKLAYYIVQA